MLPPLKRFKALVLLKVACYFKKIKNIQGKRTESGAMEIECYSFHWNYKLKLHSITLLNFYSTISKNKLKIFNIVIYFIYIHNAQEKTFVNKKRKRKNGNVL